MPSITIIRNKARTGRRLTNKSKTMGDRIIVNHKGKKTYNRYAIIKV